MVRPTPHQLRAEVWMSLIHGAAGVQYFCHRFMPDFSETDCLDDAPTEAVTIARFSLTGVGAPTSVEVIGEGRNITPGSDSFEDAFEAYAVHLYHLH